MLHIAKTKQTRRQRKREGGKATRRSTPPFSPLLAMVGGETEEEKAVKAVKDAYDKWLDIEYINKEKITALETLSNAIKDENFDGNLIVNNIGSTLLGVLLYHYYDIGGEEEADNDVASTSGIAGRTRSKKQSQNKTPSKNQQEEDFTVKHDNLLGQCIDTLLKKDTIKVDAVTKQGQSIMSSVMTIEVGSKNNFFKAVFDKSNAKKLIETYINDLTDNTIKKIMLDKLNNPELIYKDVVQLCVQDSIKDKFYNFKSRTLTKEGKKLESAIYSVGIFSKLNSTTESNKYVDDLIMFNTIIATSEYSSRILICNTLLKLLISKIKDESTELFDEPLDICLCSKSENDNSSKLEKELINNFFKNINANLTIIDDSAKKKEKKAITNEYGALILTTLIRTYESQIESKEDKKVYKKKVKDEEEDNDEEEDEEQGEGADDEASSQGSNANTI